MNLLDFALGYAAKGWPVFPCQARGKQPATSHGLHDATTDIGQIRQWWTRWPAANIGIRTGIRFDALDIDGPAGELALPRHLADNDTVDGPTVATGKGTHVYLADTGYGNRAGIVPHVDWRGAGGYVIAPPSVHPSGKAYRWERPDHPVFGPDAPLRPAPGWLLELLNPPRPAVTAIAVSTADAYGQRALEAELGRLAVAAEGERNHTLCRAAFRLGQLVAAGKLHAGTVIDHLGAVALRTGLPEDETTATIRSGLNAGISRPRTAPP